ncbi:hypothetical protein CAAN3_06S07514 [[Candida] anglica]
MKIEELPVDVWCRIIEIGHLDPQDVINLNCTSQSIRSVLSSSNGVIWNTLCYKTWEHMYDDYEMAYYPLNQYSGFERCREYMKKRMEFSYHLSLYDPEHKYNIAIFLDRFRNPVYIPIILEYIDECRMQWGVLDAGMDDFESTPDINLDLAKISLAQNILLALNFNQVVSFLLEFSTRKSDNSGTPPPLEQYEMFWFKISLYDRSCNQLLHRRRTMLNEIATNLHQKIYVKELLYGTGNCKLDQSTNTIHLIDTKSYVRLIKKIIAASMAGGRFQLHIENESSQTSPYTTEYLRDYYLEDYNVLRIYAGEVMGHPQLIYSILIKVITKFLSPFKILIDGQQDDISKSIYMTKTFLQIKDKYLFIPDKAQRTQTVELHTRRELETYLNNNSSNNHTSAGSEYLQSFFNPLSLELMAGVYVQSNMSGHETSFTSIFGRHELGTSGDNMTLMNIWFKHSHQGMLTDDHKFFSDVYKLVKSEREQIQGYRQFMEVSEFEVHFNHLNNFIHFNGLYRSLYHLGPTGTLPGGVLGRYFKVKNDQAPFTSTFDLHNEVNSRIAWGRIFQNSRVKRVEIEPVPTLPARGSFVYNTRFLVYGVVVGHVAPRVSGGDAYVKVYTNARTLEIHSERSIVKIDGRNDLIREFIECCGMDVLGLLFVKGYNGNEFEMMEYGV